jgi:hypothetical protein
MFSPPGSELNHVAFAWREQGRIRDVCTLILVAECRSEGMRATCSSYAFTVPSEWQPPSHPGRQLGGRGVLRGVWSPGVTEEATTRPRLLPGVPFTEGGLR